MSINSRQHECCGQTENLREKIHANSRSQYFSRQICNFTKPLNSRTLPSYQSVHKTTLPHAAHLGPVTKPVWYQLSLSHIPNVQQQTHVSTYDQEQSSYHGLINYSLSVEFSLTTCDHTTLRYNHKAKHKQLQYACCGSLLQSQSEMLQLKHPPQCFKAGDRHSPCNNYARWR